MCRRWSGTYGRKTEPCLSVGKRVVEGRENGLYMSVCSNHFVDGKHIASNPVLKLFITTFEQKRPSPNKRRKVARVDVYNITSKTCTSSSVEWPANVDKIAQDNPVYPRMKFVQITRECVRLCSSLYLIDFYSRLFTCSTGMVQKQQVSLKLKGVNCRRFHQLY